MFTLHYCSWIKWSKHYLNITLNLTTNNLRDNLVRKKWNYYWCYSQLTGYFNVAVVKVSLQMLWSIWLPIRRKNFTNWLIKKCFIAFITRVDSQYTKSNMSHIKCANFKRILIQLLTMNKPFAIRIFIIWLKCDWLSALHYF